MLLLHAELPNYIYLALRKTTECFETLCSHIKEHISCTDLVPCLGPSAMCLDYLVTL